MCIYIYIYFYIQIYIERERGFKVLGICYMGIVLGLYFPHSLRSTNKFVTVPQRHIREEIGDMGGCQNYGAFLDPHYNTAPNIQGTQKGS